MEKPNYLKALEERLLNSKWTQVIEETDPVDGGRMIGGVNLLAFRENTQGRSFIYFRNIQYPNGGQSVDRSRIESEIEYIIQTYNPDKLRCYLLCHGGLYKYKTYDKKESK